MGADRCGLTSLGGRPVGAPFVGAIVATLVVAELVRLANGAHTQDFMDAHLRGLEKCTVALGGAACSRESRHDDGRDVGKSQF